MSSSDESTGLVGLLNDQGWNEVGELKAQLQRRVGELTEEEIAKLLSARQTLAQRASSAASGLSRAHAVIRSLDRRLAEMEAAAHAAQTGLGIRSAVEGLDALLQAVTSLSETERGVLRAAIEGDAGVTGSPRRQETEEAPPAAESDAGDAPGLNVFEAALDRLRRSGRMSA